MRNNLFLLGFFVIGTISAFSFGYTLHDYRASSSSPLTANILSQLISPQNSSSSPASPITMLLSNASNTPLRTIVMSTSSSPLYMQNLQKSMEYKMINNMDACTLEKLSKTGWQILQMGALSTDSSNSWLDTDCVSRSYIGAIDWAVLGRER